MLFRLHLPMVDFLPFQSSIISDFLGSLLEQDPELCPGINCCMVCGAPSKQTCPACNSVHYCSDKCMEADLNNLSDDEEEAQGHTPAVCKLLFSCSSPDKDSCRSELESYPSTLSNLLLSHPSFEVSWDGNALVPFVIYVAPYTALLRGRSELTRHRFAAADFVLFLLLFVPQGLPGARGGR